MPSENSNLFSVRKVFFLYPHAVIRELYREIVLHGYDAYLIDGHAIISHFLGAYTNSILYINIDKALKDEEWLVFTAHIRNNPATSRTDIGIMTDARLKKKYLSRKYLVDIGVSCGFISLIPNPDKLLEVINKILEANEARGRRQYVRARCLKGDVCNFTFESNTVHAQLLDISLAGILCRLNEDASPLAAGTFLDDIQLKLQGALSITSGTIYGLRLEPEGERQYLILFDKESMREKSRENILSYICRRQDDFITEASRDRAASDPVLAAVGPGPNNPEDISNDQLTREVLEELELVQSGLKEIDGLLKNDDGSAFTIDPEKTFDIRS
jgi:hypothetical protein